MKVKDFMTDYIIKCNVNDEVDIIAKVMNINDIGFVAIEKNRKIIGVISEDIISIDLDSDIEDAFYLMKKYKVKRLLVTKKGKYVGVISISDLLGTDYEDTFFKTLKEIKE